MLAQIWVNHAITIHLMFTPVYISLPVLSEVVELLPQVIDWLERGLVPLSDELRDEQRLVVTENDVYQRLSGPPDDLFDVILIDVDHSPDERLGEESVSFYDAQGLLAARRHLAADGVLAVWSYAQSSPFADALREVFEEVPVEPVTYDPCPPGLEDGN